MSTRIEWCDETFNPWHGCEKVSPGCAHCYAEGQSRRFNGDGMWGAGHGFRFQSDAYWAEPLRWARTLPAKLGRRPRIFCASMADVFEERPELDEHRYRLFTLIENTPELDWLILTKRPECARDWLAGWDDFLAEDHPNIWMGASIENARHTWRADVLREIPAAVRFISAEPLLSSLYERSRNGRLTHAAPPDDRTPPVLLGGSPLLPPPRDPRLDGQQAPADLPRTKTPLDLTGIDWVIAGGESGPGARPMHPDWARQIRDACLCSYCRDMGERLTGRLGDTCSRCDDEQRAAFFFKQWGHFAPWIANRKSGGYGYILLPDGTRVAAMGKKEAGRDLDGRTWDEFPAAATGQVPAALAPLTNGETQSAAC